METRITRPETLAAGALIVAGVLLRLIPHTANFAPVGAIALFGGAVLSPRAAIALPLAVMIVSDVILGLHGTVLFTWGGFALVGLFGMLFRDVPNRLRIPLGALGGTTIFYLVSNIGVWVEGLMYAPTLQGLFDCYIAGLPFLKISLLADLVFSAALFGAYALAARRSAQPATIKP